jgi:hypothetical protein
MSGGKYRTKRSPTADEALGSFVNSLLHKNYPRDKVLELWNKEEAMERLIGNTRGFPPIDKDGTPKKEKRKRVGKNKSSKKDMPLTWPQFQSKMAELGIKKTQWSKKWKAYKKDTTSLTPKKGDEDKKMKKDEDKKVKKDEDKKVKKAKKTNPKAIEKKIAVLKKAREEWSEFLQDFKEKNPGLKNMKKRASEAWQAIKKQ